MTGLRHRSVCGAKGPRFFPITPALTPTAPEESTPRPILAELDYGRGMEGKVDGSLTPLASQLMPVLRYDHLHLHEQGGTGLRIALHIRSAGKRIFHVRLVRRGGRLLVRLVGLDATNAIAGIRVCRDHFDRWFGISGRAIEEFEDRRPRRSNPPEEGK